MKDKILQVLSYLVIAISILYFMWPLPGILSSSIKFSTDEGINYLLIFGLLLNLLICGGLIASGVNYLRKKKEKEIKEMLIGCSIILTATIHYFISEPIFTKWLGPISVLIPIGLGIITYKLLKKYLTNHAPTRQSV